VVRNPATFLERKKKSPPRKKIVQLQLLHLLWASINFPTCLKMRPLTEPETQTLFAKLANYTGRSLTQLIQPGPDGERHVFRIQNSRVYYVREEIANLATSVARDSLLSLGTCIGKFTKTGKFRLHITALDIIAPHARYKVWVKPNGEMPYLYGSNIVRAQVGRWSEDCPEHQCVVVYSMNDTPLVSRPSRNASHSTNADQGIWSNGSIFR
jgi:60S ribosome subunit biogenesis protein NIP7